MRENPKWHEVLSAVLGAPRLREAVSEQGFREAPDPVPAHSLVVGRAVSMAPLGTGARANTHTLRCPVAVEAFARRLDHMFAM